MWQKLLRDHDVAPSRLQAIQPFLQFASVGLGIALFVRPEILDDMEQCPIGRSQSGPSGVNRKEERTVKVQDYRATRIRKPLQGNIQAGRMQRKRLLGPAAQRFMLSARDQLRCHRWFGRQYNSFGFQGAAIREAYLVLFFADFYRRDPRSCH
jgi:hypothetical protein